MHKSDIPDGVASASSDDDSRKDDNDARSDALSASTASADRAVTPEQYRFLEVLSNVACIA